MAAAAQAGTGAPGHGDVLRRPRNNGHLYSEPVLGVAFHEI